MRLRLLPVLILTAGLALTARMGEIWHGFGTQAQAQTETETQTETQTQAQTQTETQPEAPAQPEKQTKNQAKPKASAQAPTDESSIPAAAPAATSVPGTSLRTANTEMTGAPLLDLPADPFSLTDEEVDLLQALAERRHELELRSRRLDQQEALLQAAERRIEEKAGGLKALQKSIESLLLQRDEQTETQYLSLVKIYEGMKPKDAARIFEDLDMAILLPVVERMKERKTAPILAKMNPEKARAITTELAQRRNLPTAKD